MGRSVGQLFNSYSVSPTRCPHLSQSIPPNFDRKWGRSDVIIQTQGEGNSVLHVSKTILATFSPVFDAMFFGGFAEENQVTVTLDIDYDVMREILRIIHSVIRNYGKTNHVLYSPVMLAKLYSAGDTFDIPMIRELCKQQFVQIAPNEAFEVTIELELHEEKSEILKKMSFQDIQAFLAKKGTSLVLSAIDVAEIVKKTQEYENSRARCTHCFSTDVMVHPNGSVYRNAHETCFICGKCRNSFYVKTKE